MMTGAELAALITALTTALTALLGGLRRLLKEIRERSYEQARAELLQKQSEQTITAKNAEIQDLEQLLNDALEELSRIRADRPFGSPPPRQDERS